MKTLTCSECDREIKIRKSKRGRATIGIAYLNGKIHCCKCFNIKLNWKLKNPKETPIVYSRHTTEKKLNAQEKIDMFASEVYE